VNDVTTVPSPYHPWLSVLVTESYKLATGSSLVPDETASHGVASFLYHAPFCLLAQDATADPCFLYANLAAQRLFGYSWQEFVGMPSRLSAGPEDRKQRQEFMDSVSARGYATGYRGKRVKKSGEHFWIEDTTVWNLTAANNTRYGQAALFRNWSDG
jgi:PAS domain S-box-containing protein